MYLVIELKKRALSITITKLREVWFYGSWWCFIIDFLKLHVFEDTNMIIEDIEQEKTNWLTHDTLLLVWHVLYIQHVASINIGYELRRFQGYYVDSISTLIS